MMYQKILAPLDGSEIAECTLRHLKTIGTGCNVPEIVLLMVVEPVRQAYGIGEHMVRDARQKAEDAAKDYLSRMAKDLEEDGARIETVVVSGQPEEAILDYVEKNQVDLVIMSTHGRSGVSRWLLGSVAQRVANHSPVPVLMVPSPFRARG
ncbi:MAG: universal stress protein [Chloroflexota bacterium]